MKLIGMLDSPYVRRTAICMTLLGVKFEHEAVSVFSTYEAFEKINPVVKAPTLVFDDGRTLMDSTLIIDCVSQWAEHGASLWPAGADERRTAYMRVGLALAACEKTVQIVYERKLRPAEKVHQPWIERVSGQLLAAYGALEAELAATPPSAGFFGLAEVSIAVAWRFTQMMVPEIVPAERYPALRAFSELAERRPEFIAYPHN
jgi:glutathione S-transferase